MYVCVSVCMCVCECVCVNVCLYVPILYIYIFVFIYLFYNFIYTFCVCIQMVNKIILFNIKLRQCYLSSETLLFSILNNVKLYRLYLYLLLSVYKYSSKFII